MLTKREHSDRKVMTDSESQNWIYSLKGIQDDSPMVLDMINKSKGQLTVRCKELQCEIV